MADLEIHKFRHMKNTLLILLGFVIALSACKQEGTPTGSIAAPPVDSTAIKTFVEKLASDEFMGRKPFTPGEEITVNYIQEQFQNMGLQPGNADSYFQEVPMVEITTQAKPLMTLKGIGGNFNLELKKDYSLYTSREAESVDLENSEMVFCGYGIVAPEYGWNDYEGIDMKGKTAVVMVNDPGFATGDSTLFKGKTMTYYGRWTYKYEEASRQGAAACLVIHETNAAGYPWFVVGSLGSGGANLFLQSPDKNQGNVALQGWIGLNAASKIFQASGIKEGRFFEKAQQKGFKPIPLGVTMTAGVANQLKRDLSRNVVALLPGSDKKEEYVVYTAHWDHLGVGAPVAGDSIYNGALDNASGTASILAIAKAYSQMPVPPSRSIVFLIVTAEEQGLLGSAFYARNPIYPLDRTVANLNMDGVSPFGPMKDLTITGFGHSQMDDYASQEAEKQGRYVVPDQEPEKGFFFRSDQFNFAKVGVPVLFASGGYDHAEKGKEYAEAKQKEFTANHYHQPSDRYDPATWDVRGMVLDAQLYFNLGMRLANESTFPQWKEGSEFKSKRVLKD